MGSPRNATRKPSVSAASSYQLRPGSARGCAAKAAWTTHHVGAHALTVELLGNPLRPVGVVLDSRDAETAQRPALAEQAGQPHRGGAPWLVRPAQSGESIAGGLVGELPTRSGTAAAGRTRPQPTATRRSAARPSQSQGHRQRAPPARLAADFTLLAAAVNLARLATLGLTHTSRHGWTLNPA